VLDDEGMHFKDEADELCILCGHCIAACPVDAVAIDELPKEGFPPLADSQATSGQLQELMDGRRSIRAFLDRPVEREKLERIIEAVSTVPVGCGGNPLPVTVIDGREKLVSMLGPMMEFYRKLSKGMRSPIFKHVLKWVLGKNRYAGLQQFMPLVERMVEYYDATGNDCITWGAPALMIFHAPRQKITAETDPVISCTYAMLAAHAEGLGTTMIGMIPPFLNENAAEKKRLGIPPKNAVVLTLIVGYPKGKYARGIRRQVEVNWV
jgi:nitroreductase